MTVTRVAIQNEDFDVGSLFQALHAADAGTGAVVGFVGTVRGRDGVHDVQALELEHYPGMTEQAIEAMIDAAVGRFGLRAARVVHRVGRLAAGENIVFVGVAAPHRRAAFEGCEFLMDYLKTQAPFWKKETTPEGTRWVDARAADDAALARWGLDSDNAANA
nr:molybdopterin synthase catalytic subunit MoaE [Rubrivivax gelatinosus]